MNRITYLSDWLYKPFPFLMWLPMLDRKTLKIDTIAGITAGILILPQAIALATLAGMPPEYGFYTAIFPVIIAALYGSSWHTLSGPNTALCIVMAFALAPYASESTPNYIMYAITLTFMAGVIQLAFGLLKLGVIFNYFSYSVRVAIITGVGIIIIVQQVGNFLGLTMNTSEPIEDTLVQIFYSFPLSNWYAVFVGTITVVSGLIVKRWLKKWPYLIVAVVMGMLVAQLLDLLFGSATVNLDKLGTMTLSPLPFSAPDFSPENFAEVAEGLYTAAFVVAVVGLMQSSVIARAMSAKSGQYVDMNQEVVGQGLSNIGGSFFSCFPSCGSFNRSAANVEAGAITPLAGIISALAVGLLVIFANPIIAEMPVTVMAGVLFLVGAGLINFGEIKKLLRCLFEYRFVFVVCLVTTVYGGIDNGVFLGTFLSVVSYLRSASKPDIKLSFSEESGQYVPTKLKNATVLQIAGSVFFGSLHIVDKILTDIGQRDKHKAHLIIVGEYLQHLDAAGAEMLAQETNKRKQNGYQLELWLRDDKLDSVLLHSGLMEVIGKENIHYTYGRSMSSMVAKDTGISEQ
jgi:SulP family sulfate permease